MKSGQSFLTDRRSFTLIELALVMLVVIILSGALVGSVGYINRKAAEAKTQALLAKVSAALENYNADWGMYPLADSNSWNRGMAQTNFNTLMMTNLGGLSPGKKQYLTWGPDETNNVVAGGEVRLYIVDGFGTPICYDPRNTNTCYSTVAHGLRPDGKINFTYDLWSCGADLQSIDDTTFRDDLKNWD